MKEFEEIRERSMEDLGNKQADEAHLQTGQGLTVPEGPLSGE